MLGLQTMALFEGYSGNIESQAKEEEVEPWYWSLE